MPALISRAAYADMYGPTTGDRVRLADTDLVIEVEKDLTTYGEEVKFGGGKVIRDGMGQSQATRAEGAVDTVITNALILDVTGIYKADVGLRDGRIAKIGKAGNPDTQPGVDIIIGPGTEAIAGEGRILTAGGFDSHIHFICPQQIEDALHSGLTTMLGGGTGPAHGTLATTCTPGPWHIGRMLQALDAFPMNFGLSGKGNASQPAARSASADGTVASRCGANGRPALCTLAGHALFEQLGQALHHRAAEFVGIDQGDGATGVAGYVVTDADGGQLDRRPRFDPLNDIAEVPFKEIPGVCGQGSVVHRRAVGDDHQDAALFVAADEAAVRPQQRLAVDVLL